MPDESAADRAASRAIADGAAVADRADRLRMWFSGPSAADALNGLVTNDVVALAPGAGCYAAALTPKGKVIADVRILRREDGLLVDVAPAAAPGWTGMIRKFVNPRLARYEDRTASSGCVGVHGPDAARVLRESLSDADVPAGTSAYGHTTVEWNGEPLIVLRSPDFGVDGFDVIGSPAATAAIRDRFIAAGAVPATPGALEIARVEAGRPAWGTDMDENTLAQEADMDRLGAISYSKGCYTGQETVARVHFRGHVNRLLRGLRCTGDTLPSAGTAITDGAGKTVGEVRSVVRSGRFGVIALALVRREIEPGTTVQVGDVPATVVELPFSG